jgi:hypothetical protein
LPKPWSDDRCDSLLANVIDLATGFATVSWKLRRPLRRPY